MNQQYIKASTLRLFQEKCVGCGMCEAVCPHEVFLVNNKKSEIINRDACMECGACMKNCPFKAIYVRAGVGCAAAVINGMLGGSGDCCC